MALPSHCTTNLYVQSFLIQRDYCPFEHSSQQFWNTLVLPLNTTATCSNATYYNSQYTLDVGGARPAWDAPLPQTTADAFAIFALLALKKNKTSCTKTCPKRSQGDPLFQAHTCTYHGEQGAIHKAHIIVQ